MVCVARAELMWSGLALKNWFWRGLFVLHFTSLVFAKEKKEFKAKLGESALLPCCYELPSPESLYNYRVYWQTIQTEVIQAYSAGKPVPDSVPVNSKYVNRTEMDLQNLTLLISPVELSDNNTYECIVQVLENGAYKRACAKSVVLVVVADFSKPVISADVPKDACGSTEVMVNCSSHGGFAEPRVSGILNNMSVDWQTNLSDSKDSLYNVTAKLQLNLTEDIFLTCTIEYDVYKVSSNYTLKKLKECPSSPTPSPQGVIIASSLVLICIFLVAIALLFKYFRCHGCDRLRCSHYPVPQDPAVGTEMKEGVRGVIELSEVISEAASF
ncbi:T-lymphocyte activation antigen CD80 [Gopherus flavomarginatus]|uniref:T-lymphocyte activation antigen CD80 n=1 Tax=Gopherus flavomarginatus TaxID=286002 RepID=UPI0021CC4821|nr:T-lymphocyte activation antigen CD80 [Gopherus flavomarginatus]